MGTTDATVETFRTRPERLPVGMLLAFAVGAALGAVATRAMGIRAVWLGAALLMVMLMAIVAEARSVERATP